MIKRGNGILFPQDKKAASVARDDGGGGVRQREDVGRDQPGSHIVPDEAAVVHDRGRQRTEPVQRLGDHGTRRVPEQNVPAALGQLAVGGLAVNR